MRNPARNLWGYGFIICISLFFTGSVFGQTLPAGVRVEKGFKPGQGQAVGAVQIVQGTTLVRHKKDSSAYAVKRNMPLFKGDTIITMRRSLIRFKLGDGSSITLASNSSMTINSSMYNPAKKERSSFYNMKKGKSRFLIKKLMGFDRTDVKIKTKTAILGVRGSDFIVVAGDDFTKITALEDTHLEVLSISRLEEPALMLKDFEQTIVYMNEAPSKAMRLPPEEIERMIRNVPLEPELFEAAAMIEVHDESGDKKGDSGESSKDSEPAGKQEPPGDQVPPPGDQAPPPGDQVPPPGDQVPPPGDQPPPPGDQPPPPGTGQDFDSEQTGLLSNDIEDTPTSNFGIAPPPPEIAEQPDIEHTGDNENIGTEENSVNDVIGKVEDTATDIQEKKGDEIRKLIELPKPPKSPAEK